MNDKQDKQKEKSQYEENMKNLSLDERIKYEQDLLLSSDKEELYQYMDGLISKIMNRLRNKKDITIPIDENFREKLHEKVNRAAVLYQKNIEKNKKHLFSVYYSYFINEVLEEMGE